MHPRSKGKRRHPLGNTVLGGSMLVLFNVALRFSVCTRPFSLSLSPSPVQNATIDFHIRRQWTHRRAQEAVPAVGRRAHTTEPRAGGGAQAPPPVSAAAGPGLSVGFMRMDGAAGVIYTDGEDKSRTKCIHCIRSSGEISGK